MVRVITLLSFWQIRNAVRTSLTDYRKLIPLLVVAFFVGTQVLTAVLMAGARPTHFANTEHIILEQIETIRTMAFVVLGLITIGIIDYGFTEGFLAFSLADVDYLFPSPAPPRLILAYRLASKTLQSFFQAALFFYFLIWRALESMAPGKATIPAGLTALMGLFFCLGGYASLAFALKMIFGFGRLGTIRRWTIAALIGLVGLVAYSFWSDGISGVTSLTRNAVIVTLFYPCRLASEALTAPLVGQSSLTAVAQLAVFYIAALVLLFSRRENFYEASLEGSEKAARLLQAAKEQNWGAIFAAQAANKPRNSGRARPYSLPLFGKGGGALLWANFCAAAKRPVPNFWGPLLGGIALPVVSLIWMPQDFAALVVAGFTCYLLFLMSMAGMAVFRQSVTREPLIRPLPFPAWQVVAADVIPRTASTAIFAVAAGLVVGFSPARHASTVGPLLVFCLPTAILALNLVQYMLALWYPDAQDKLQQILAGFISLFLTMGVVSIMGVAIATPLALRAPGWLAALIFLVPTLIATAILLWCATLAYRKFQPKG